MLDVKIHRIHLTNILTLLYKDASISARLGFKGGTAAYLFYNLPRFSVDLDFDFIDQPSDDRATDTMERIRRSLEKHYRIVEQRLKYHTLFLLISYERYQRKIKIEISVREHKNKYESRNFYGVTIPVMSLGDMMAHKLVAIMDRKMTANRDLFDAHFFLSNPRKMEINYQIIEDLTGLKPRGFFSKLSEFVTSYRPVSILSGLGELLDESQKIWVKTKLQGELMNLIQMEIDLQTSGVPGTSANGMGLV